MSRRVPCECCDNDVREDGLSKRRWCIKCELEFEALQRQIKAREVVLQFPKKGTM